MSSNPEERPLREHIAEAAACLKDFLAGTQPAVALILGSGLNFYADTLEDIRTLPFKEVPHLRVSSAEGHVGQFVLGTVPGTEVKLLCMQGRIHAYEGADAWDVAFPVWVMAACGIMTLITTNAAGAIDPSFEVGNFCVMTDHINLTGRNPLVGLEPDKMAQRFVPMDAAYDEGLRVLLLEKALEQGVKVHEGVYLGLLGPSFETPAEIRMFSRWGASTVAMSVVEEVIAARHQGMRVMGLSLISNMACGIGGAKPDSDEVMDIAKQVEPDFARLMNAFFAAFEQVGSMSLTV